MTIRFKNLHEAMQAYQEDARGFERLGVINPYGKSYMLPEYKEDYRRLQLAMDAQPALTTVVNAGVPAFLTNIVDPAIYEILFAPNEAATIYGEEKKGDWTSQTAFFPTVEHTGEVTSYGDYSESGSAGANTNWPQRQAYLFQTFKEYGELELERAGLAKINWVSEIDKAATLTLNKFSNLSYFFGIANLQNYGALNDPNLPASLTPSAKAYGGTAWQVSGVTQATANEIFKDVQSIFNQLVLQTQGLVNARSPVTLAMHPSIEMSLTTTNAFNVNVMDLLKKNFPSLKVMTAVQYGQSNAANPQGLASGNLVQMFCENVEGQKTVTCAFNEKMRAHKIVIASSSYKQKITGGTWGTVNRQPFAVASMLGV